MSADKDWADRRLEFGRRMRVRRIAGSLQIATGVLAVILLLVAFGALGGDRVDNLTLVAMFGLLLWFAASGPAEWLAERIEAWLSSPL
ncbi:hypothetical protein [Methylobacterium sp. J-076]|uniref:hypothetical protein n=1 Tax=Methylobacterium sp. J-076 TaxID=2836655 RepID=UPI001FB88090|nr:hypothetical protein [Methylobacterium sp. J-076]MCJ2013305.1 hypothetical protein [Methylobacterium sp. J-076]